MDTVRQTPNRRPRIPRAATFTAIDFETANRQRTSACAVGLVRVERGQIVRRAYHLIRPPFRGFEFTDVHHIDWPLVRDEPTFAELWPKIEPFFREIDFLAAHNVAFDAGVLRATCRWYGIAPPRNELRCTVRLARDRWHLHPATLRHVAEFLGLRLNHHHAGSDAEACAEIVMRASARADVRRPLHEGFR
jgi:DNA polymerase-3 subunit epsilon